MFNDRRKTLKELLTETMDLRGLNIERLSALTNIPKRHLAAFCGGDFKNLPAAPYVRGYLVKLAETLGVDGDLFWRAYQSEHSPKTSGAFDKLPSNRFAIKRFNKKVAVVAIVSLFVIIYLAWRINEFWGVPTIEIISPAADGLIVNSPTIKLAGRINSADKLTVNGEEIVSDSGGRFEKEFALQPGINTAEFKVKKILGKETKIIRQIIYQP